MSPVRKRPSPRTKDHVLERDKPDARDHIYQDLGEHHGRKLPASVDLRPHALPVYNQMNTESCTAHAVSGAYAHQRRLSRARHFRPSPRFVYYNERAMTNQLEGDCVVGIRDALKAIAKYGVCPAHLWRFSDGEDHTVRRPPQHAFQAARSRRIQRYLRIDEKSLKRDEFLHQLKSCLAAGHPFLFAFTVYPNFTHGWKKWKNGIMPTPGPLSTKKVEHHAVVAVGYDDDLQAFLVRNSWGPEFALKGYFRMPYKIITNPKFAFDFWTIRGVTG